MTLHPENQITIADWLKMQILPHISVIKYGVVGCTGILINLGTMALLFTVSSQRGWMQSGVASIVSTGGNFFFHNLWTFSDRQHQGLRLLRGFLLFGFTSAVGICITTAAYMSFTRIAAFLTITNFHLGGLGIVLSCQFAAILLGGAVSYALNRKFTWAQAKKSPPAQEVQVL